MTETKVNLNLNLTVEDIATLKKNLIEECTSRCDSIANTTDFTYNNVIMKLCELERVYSNDYSVLQLLDEVSPKKEIRDACNEAVSELSKFEIELSMRKDIFDVLQKFKETNKETLTREAERYLERSIIERKQDGLHLDEETRNKVKELKKKISDLQIKFSKHVNDENSKFAFKKEELDGINEDVLNALEKDENGNYLVTLKYPVYFPLMKECKVPETRRKMLIEFDSRCVKENTPIIEEVIELRHQLATLLGYKTYSEYALELCMAKNPKNVDEFLEKLTKKLRKLQETELAILLKYKKEECEKLNIPFDGKIRQSDIKYFTNLREQLEFKIDHTKLQQYFPLNVVLDGIFDIYQRLLNLKFELITDAVNYHDEVNLYQVRDKNSYEIIGYFYSDMHPREGKFGHAAVFPLIKGCLKEDGKRQLPVCNMVCNFTKPTSDKPSLLTHDEVETFFHEFGHVMHNVCAKATFSKFGGTSVETDFVEAPSQMLENWVWEKESLKLMSKHYKDGTAIDETLLNDLVKSKQANAGYFNLRQILFATIDQLYHSNPKSDTKAIYQKFSKELLLYDMEDEKMNMVASFQHLIGGYEAKYYSYLWSEVFSQDMFDTRFKKEGILNPLTGLDYRKYILAPGGSLDAEEMLVNFLGRKPNEEAFLKSKGLSVEN